MTLPMAIPMVSIPGADAAKKAASDIATGVKDVTNGMKDTATTVKNTIDFASDPMGYMAKELQSADHWLVSNLFGAMLKVVHPDYSKDWFTNCYRISFAIAFMGMIFLVIKLMLDRAAGRISGEELVNSLALRAPAWVVGVSLGPSIAAVILGAVGVLTDGVATWMGTSPVDIIKSLSEQIDKADFGAVAGGSLIAIAIFFLLFVSFILVFLTLLGLLVAQYFLGVVFPIAWVWMIGPRQRRRSARAITLFVGFALSPAAIFFALGFSYRMIGGLVMSIGDGFIQSLANLFVAFLALVVTTCTPFLLIKYMPVGLDGLVDQGQTWDPKGMNLPRHDSTSSGTAEESSQSFMEQADSGSLTSSGGSSLMKRVQDKLNNGEGAAGKGPAGAGGKPGMGEAAGTAAETEGAAGAAGAAEAATAVAAPEVAAAAAAAEALHKTGEKAEQVGEKATDAATKTAEKTAGDTAHHAGAPVDPGSAQPGQKNPLSEAQEVRTDQAPTSGEADHPTAQQPEAPGSAGQVREESAKGATMAPEGAGSVEGLAGEQPSSNVAAGEPENAEGHAEAAGDGDPRDGLALAGATGATAAQDLTGTSGLDDGSEPTVPIPLDDGTYAAGGGLGDGAETAPDGGESAVLADDSTVDASWGEGLASGSYSDPTEPAGIDSGAAPAADLVADGGSGAGGLSGDPAVEQGTPVGGTADSGFADGNTSGESLATTSSSGASLTGETFTGASHGETTASSGLGQAPASDVQAGGISHGEAAGETLVGGGYGEGTAAGGHGGSPITGETMTSSGSVENSSYVEAPATGQSLTNDSYTDAPPTGGYSEGTGFAETTSGGQGGAPVTDGYDQGPGYTEAPATGETTTSGGHGGAPTTGETLASSSSVGGASGAAGQEYVERDPYTSGRSTGVSEEEMSSTAGESSQSAWGRLGALAAGAAAAGLTQSKAHGARAADHMTRPHGYEDRDPYRGRRS